MIKNYPTVYLFISDMVHTRSLERGSGGILKQFGVVAGVDDQPIDPLGVAKLGTTQENLV